MLHWLHTYTAKSSHLHKFIIHFISLGYDVLDIFKESGGVTLQFWGHHESITVTERKTNTLVKQKMFSYVIHR